MLKILLTCHLIRTLLQIKHMLSEEDRNIAIILDLFIILKNGFGLKRIIVDAKEKFAGEFSEKLFLSQLIYFEDLKDFTVELIKEKYSVDEIKSFFKQAVLNYL